MGLIGMARRAGAARGAYLAAQEAYHRQRQGMLDDITRQRFELDKAKHAQDMTVSKNTEARNAEKHAFNMASGKAREEREAAKHAQDMIVSKNTEARNATLFNQGQEDRKNYTIPHNSKMLELIDARLDALDQTNEQAKINQQRQDDIYNRRMAAMSRMSQQDRDNYLLYGTGRYNPSLAKMTHSGRQSASSGKAKPPFSDTRIENIAAHATPDQMKNVFDQVYNITDKDMLRKTGKTRDQYLKDANDDYAEHIRTQGANVMTRKEFLEQHGKQYGFRPIYDLNKYMDARNEDVANKPSAMGNWWREYVYGKPYGTYHYEKNNPTIYKKQQDLVAYITAASKGESPKDINSFIRTPRIARIFMDAMDNGIPTKNAKKYVFDQYRRGAR